MLSVVLDPPAKTEFRVVLLAEQHKRRVKLAGNFIESPVEGDYRRANSGTLEPNAGGLDNKYIVYNNIQKFL